MWFLNLAKQQMLEPPTIKLNNLVTLPEQFKLKIAIVKS